MASTTPGSFSKSDSTHQKQPPAKVAVWRFFCISGMAAPFPDFSWGLLSAKPAATRPAANINTSINTVFIFSSASSIWRWVFLILYYVKDHPAGIKARWRAGVISAVLPVSQGTARGRLPIKKGRTHRSALYPARHRRRSAIHGAPRRDLSAPTKSLFPGVFHLSEDRQFDRLDLAVDLIRTARRRSLHREEVRARSRCRRDARSPGDTAG